MLETIWEYIGRTNLFNFIIFFGIFALIFAKINLVGMLKSAKKSIAEEIRESKNARKESEGYLKRIENTVSNIEKEIDKIFDSSNKNAQVVGEKIVEDANKTAENITQNSIKLVENKTELVKNEIINRVSKASVEIAKKHIINELNNNYELHYKLIDESINAINNINV